MHGNVPDEPAPDRGINEFSSRETDSTNDDSQAVASPPDSDEPDVFLDVPVLNVDEINLEVDDLRAHVSLQAEVLDLVRLNVGADVTLGKVALSIKGVEAQALLKVRLDNVSAIVGRVLTTIDRNPQILEHVTRGVESAAEDVGRGAGRAVGEVGSGAGEAVHDVGKSTGAAVENVGEGAGDAVHDVGKSTGTTVENVGEGAGKTVAGVGEVATAEGTAGEKAPEATNDSADASQPRQVTEHNQQPAPSSRDRTGRAAGSQSRRELRRGEWRRSARGGENRRPQ